MAAIQKLYLLYDTIKINHTLWGVWETWWPGIWMAKSLFPLRPIHRCWINRSDTGELLTSSAPWTTCRLLWTPSETLLKTLDVFVRGTNNHFRGALPTSNALSNWGFSFISPSKTTLNSCITDSHWLEDAKRFLWQSIIKKKKEIRFIIINNNKKILIRSGILRRVREFFVKILMTAHWRSRRCWFIRNVTSLTDEIRFKI